MKTPCRDCQIRATGCHGRCPAYQAYRQEIEKLHQYNEKFRYIDPMRQTHEMEKKNRQKKYKGGNQ